MNDNPDIDAAIEEMKTKAAQVQAALAEIRGTATAGNGAITAIVDSGGHLRDLKLHRGALQLGDKLAGMILQATAAAERDAAAKAELALRPLTQDQRVEAGMRTIRETLGRPEAPAPKALTEEEIQAADDAYFARRNQQGWNR
ncbi:YbaB/EbfC family nucleoid-associated protein [Nocardia sp. NBC_01730]|uniref:YbaB/EbfC family nucleoid-associated protein n=1 Tax=Nocardia sp. NBC_01730 TaxID=2975998 RepID=UPI002E1656EB|nr:YbaB/EbfC family nucleoid-associated protein [Nocardia sp. NBC_01730]